MPAFLSLASLAPFLATFFRFLVGYAITRAIVVLGLTFVTYKGINYVGDTISGYLYSSINSLGADFLTAFSAVGGFAALSIILAAENASLMIRAAMGIYQKLTVGKTIS